MKPPSPRVRWTAYAIALAFAALGAQWAGGQGEPAPRLERAQTTSESAPATAPEVAAAPATSSEVAARMAPEVPGAMAPGTAAISPSPGPAIDLARLEKRQLPMSGKDLFPAVSWTAKAQEEAQRNAPPPPPPPKVKPQAPPLPFTFMGRMIDGGQQIVFLVNGDRNLVVREGETFAGSYRVDKIDDQAVTLTYLPLRQKQRLAFASESPPRATGAAPRMAATRPAEEEDE